MFFEPSSLSDNEIEAILVKYDAHIDAEEGSAGQEIGQAAWSDLYDIHDSDTRVRVIEIASRMDIKRWTLDVLGCGILEDLCYQGEAAIERIEELAATRETVRFMLSCVWYYGVDEAIYVRVREIVDRLGPQPAQFWREPRAEHRADSLKIIAEYYSD